MSFEVQATGTAGAPKGAAADASSFGAGGATPIRDRYELGERLAEGVLFTIFRARELESGRSVAVKVLKPEFAQDEAFVTRLLADAQRAVRLRHPHIAEVYEARREQNTVVLVTEWVRGINLKDRIIRVAPFPLAVTMDILLACAEAVNFAHKQGMVHGDLRPDNVIITPDGRVKITDFGVAGAVATSSKAQMVSLNQAAPYQAPEVTQGRAPEPGSDIYSLGCSLFEMLSGDPPYASESPLTLVVKHLNDPIPSLRKLNNSVPVAIEGMTNKCLQKSPGARYLKVEDLLQDIHAIRDALRNDRPLTWSPMDRQQGPVRAASQPAAPPQKAHPVSAARTSTQSAKRAAAQESDGGPSLKLLLGLLAFAGLMIAGFIVTMGLLLQAPSTVAVPLNLVGMSEIAARAELAKLNLKAETRQEFNEKQTPGTVFNVQPPGGHELRAGKSVVLSVSKGAEPVTVPDVVGKEVAAAQNAVRAAGLVVGGTKEEFSEVIPKGQVMAQTPGGEQRTAKKTPVELTLSKGPEPIPEPKTVHVDPVEPPPTGEGENGGEPGEVVSQQQEVTVEIPARSNGPQRVRIAVVQDDNSEDTVYDGEHQAGDTVRETVTTRGRKGKQQIRIYINNKLVPQANYGG